MSLVVVATRIGNFQFGNHTGVIRWPKAGGSAVAWFFANEIDVSDLDSTAEENQVDPLAQLGCWIVYRCILTTGKSRIARALEGPRVYEAGIDKFVIGWTSGNSVEIADEHNGQGRVSSAVDHVMGL